MNAKTLEMREPTVVFFEAPVAGSGVVSAVQAIVDAGSALSAVDADGANPREEKAQEGTKEGAKSTSQQQLQALLSHAEQSDRPLLTLDQGVALESLGDGRYRAEIAPEWNVFRGPNGGFIAALMLQAIITRVDTPTRKPRVLSVHYPSVPHPGNVEIHTRILRSGRSVTWIAAELYAAGELKVTASAALSEDWPSMEYAAHTPPALPPPPSELPPRFAGLPPFVQHFDVAPAGATPLTPKTHDFVGGYLRLREPRPHDAVSLAAFSDAWFPASFAHDPRFPMAATLDLTIHFRNYAALAKVSPSDYLLTLFRSRLASEGFFEEEGELWSQDGVLLAQSRQLAIATPLG